MAKSKATVPATLAPAPLPATPKVRYAPRSWQGSDTITVNVPNPKRGDSQLRYALYHNGQSVSEYQAAVVGARLGTKTKATADLRWDVARGYITIAPAS